jgi:hypothetical protein
LGPAIDDKEAGRFRKTVLDEDQPDRYVGSSVWIHSFRRLKVHKSDMKRLSTGRVPGVVSYLGVGRRRRRVTRPDVF